MKYLRNNFNSKYYFRLPQRTCFSVQVNLLKPLRDVTYMYVTYSYVNISAEHNYESSIPITG